MLKMVYERSNAGYLSRALVNHEKAPREGLYLHLSEPVGYARVRLGADELTASFDILPAVTETNSEIIKYAFLLRHPLRGLLLAAFTGYVGTRQGIRSL